MEFFIPFDLAQVTEGWDAETCVREFSVPQLQKAAQAADGILWKPEVAEGRSLTGFDVYLGTFDKSELARVTGNAPESASAADSEFVRHEQEQRSELEGSTSFARIRLDIHGEPQFDEVCVSTVPWALGCVLSHGLTGLVMESFEAATETLKAVLRDFRITYPRAETSTPDERNEPKRTAHSGALDSRSAEDLLHLLEVFYEWAGFRPRQADPHAPVVAVRARSMKKRADAEEPTALPDENHVQHDDPVSDQHGGDAEEPGDTTIAILNSFYARDIERVIKALEDGDVCPVLQAYLSSHPVESRIDLSLPAGKELIMAELHPARLNAGQWLGEPEHAMSLMQQFAINSIFGRLKAGGLFSVNGPPGTGKTTLLRDIIAENITRRARAMSRLDRAKDAFTGRVTVHFAGADRPSDISVLREELTGFEMVVASSNNAAVENISKDLPRAGSLGKAAWRDAAGPPRCTYLQPIAHALAARLPKGDFVRLEGDDVPWGLVSRTLGKKSNCDAFVNGLFFLPRCDTPKPPRGFDPKQHKTIWQWRDGYSGPGFAEAKRVFAGIDAQVSQRVARLARYAAVQAEFGDGTEAAYAAHATREEERTRLLLADARASLGVAEAECDECAALLANLREDELLVQKGRPPWWQRLFNRPSYARYRNELAANRNAQRVALRKLRAAQAALGDCRRAEQQAEAACKEARRAVTDCVARWRGGQEEMARLRNEFPQAASPGGHQDLEAEARQTEGLWRDTGLNRLREELFAASLQLHEAWLAEVLRTGGGFAQNVIAMGHLLSGKGITEREHARLVWQSLFMVVPVVSSTFASIARQFAALDANSLGWLFIDEAGQAIPQAAVGALWRAKRAVVVGDPRQIEPVFTVPIRLLEAIAASSCLPPGQDVAPHRISVQSLADAANPLGTLVGTGWIGSPLRVHRRCVEPMFSLANAIAYEGKMVHGGAKKPPAYSLDLGPSAWVHAPGPTLAKQVVAGQTQLVHQALASLYVRTGELPPVYIISPFKRIKQALVAQLSDPYAWRVLPEVDDVPLPQMTRLRDWCAKNIGTVHTFQGKEESIVWMVLGCDESTRGAAEWAASKPNLLNVALTRAKHRFFMIGDVDLWGGLKHFEVARGTLPTIRPEEWLRRVQAVQPAV